MPNLGFQFEDEWDRADRRAALAKTDKEYGKAYRRGIAASRRFTGTGHGKSPLEKADDRGEQDAWYHGYEDHAAGRID